MKILMLNYNNPMQTSGIVALDLFNVLRGKGHTVKLLVNSYDNSYPEGIISMETLFLKKKAWLLEKFVRRYNKLLNKINLSKKIIPDPNYHFHELNEDIDIYRTKKILRKAEIVPDAIIVLFAKNFVNAKNIYELSKFTKAPVFWLMYDMAPLTGGCHYAWDCRGYQTTCGTCPGLNSDNPYDLSYKNLKFKMDYLKRSDVHLITASEWQYRQAKSSSLFRDKTIHKILLSVDNNIFKPADKTELRKRLKIGEDKKIIFFGSVYMSHKRKGMSYLLESLKILKENIKGTALNEQILLLIAGREIEEFVDELPFNHHFMGYLDNNYGIASAFQAADVFLCPSIEDSGPQMINQAIMCGTPVVSFEMGVSPDLVITGKTGYLARLRDSEDLATGLNFVLSQPVAEYNTLSINCRELGLQLCLPSAQTDKIEKIIENTIRK